MADLITQERAKLNLPSAVSADNKTLDALVRAASDAVRRYCRRDFALQGYDELYPGRPGFAVLLRQYPVVSLESVRGGLTTVLTVTNAGAANQQARVAVTRTGLTLMRMASGVKSLDTSLTFAAYPTISSLAAAVNALGNGWAATANAAYASWPCADLRYPDGARNAKNVSAELRLHANEIADYDLDDRLGVLTLRALPFGDLPTDCAAGLRVQYTAGHDVVPEAVQEACAQWAAHLFWLTKRDPVAAADYFQRNYSKPPPGVAALLAPYRSHR